jgi:hypothetical protein
MLWCGCSTISFSQGEHIGFGFRAGLSYSRFDGPSEIDINGNDLESYSANGGFLIGGMFNYKFTDLVGLRTEFTYSQRGTKYTYEGPSYFRLEKNQLNELTLQGTRHQTLSVKNTYIDIPLLAYYKIGKFEIHGGLNTGFLVSSTGGGAITFEGISPLNGNALPAFNVSLDHNYKSDEALGGSEATKSVNIDGRNYSLPVFLGAYYDFEEKNKDLYKTLDFGLAIGASFFINEGLFLSARYIHGLGDVDRNDYDVSLQSLNGSSYIPRADENKSKSWQFCVGFSF